MTPTQIKSLRSRFGDTQAEFYDRLGLKANSTKAKRQVVSRWETGVRSPGPGTRTLLEQLMVRPLG
jgi:DNA-binding transcriptional regulator YiaG